MRQRKSRRATFYQESTEPFLPMIPITTPIPHYLLPRNARARQPRRGIRRFFAAIISLINFLLGLGLALTLLLLFARFLLNSAHFSYLPYTSWILRLSAPLVAPLDRYLPGYAFARYTIDLPTLATMCVCLLAVLIVREILKKLIR